MADMTLDQLRAAALEVFNMLRRRGVVPEQSQRQGTGLPHAAWLCYKIGKTLNNAQQARGFMGYIQATLIYEGVWTQRQMLDRALAWSQNDFVVEPEPPPRPRAPAPNPPSPQLPRPRPPTPTTPATPWPGRVRRPTY